MFPHFPPGAPVDEIIQAYASENAVILDDFLGSEALAQMISIYPGEKAQPLHRDRWAWPGASFSGGAPSVVNCMWALTEFSERNGATVFAPRSAALADDTPYQHPRAD